MKNTDAIKQEAITKAIGGIATIKEISEEYGFNYKTFSRWVKQAKEGNKKPTTVKGAAPANALSLEETIAHLHHFIHDSAVKGNVTAGVSYAANAMKILTEMAKNQAEYTHDEEGLLERLLNAAGVPVSEIGLEALETPHIVENPLVQGDSTEILDTEVTSNEYE